MKFKTYAYTNVGGRGNNEDYCLYNNNMWVLADGLGGHDSGEVASKLATETMEQYARKNRVTLEDDSLMTLIDVANRSVIEGQQEDKNRESMRTTIVFALSNGKVLRYANVGDSRFYYFRQGRLLVQSEDHSVSAASVKMGDIQYEDIRNDPDRNKLIKVLGNSEEINVTIPEIQIVPEKGDAFLLCSDGFWEPVYEAEMETDLAKSETPEEWIHYMAKRIVLKTHNQDHDNYTAIGVMVE